MRQIIVPEPKERTLEALLRAALPLVPGEIIKNALKRRDVKRDGKRLSAGDVVRPGEVLQLYIDDKYLIPNMPVVFEDDRLVIVCKPAGICTENDPYGLPTVESIAKERWNAAPCHRLDCHTGGLLVLAKGQENMQICEDALRERLWKKVYLCQVKGVPEPKKAHLTAWWKKDAGNAKVEIRDRKQEGYLPVETAYKVVKAGEISLVEVELITGRTHQIRAHMAHIGHPLLGDDRYGDREWNKKHRLRFQRLWAARLTLHFPSGPLADLDGKTFENSPPWL